MINTKEEYEKWLVNLNKDIEVVDNDLTRIANEILVLSMKIDKINFVRNELKTNILEEMKTEVAALKKKKEKLQIKKADLATIHNLVEIETLTTHLPI